MKKKNKKSNKSFGILFFFVFIIYSSFPLIDGENIRVIPLLIAFVFLVLGIINSNFLNPLHFVWVKIGDILGKIIAPFVMALIYFIIITPIGLSMRFFGKDLLKVNFSKVNSYWIIRKKNIGPMKRQF